MKSLFAIQTESGQLWPDIVAHLNAKDEACAAIIAAKDLEIASLQPGYVVPEHPTVAQRVEDAVLAVLTDDEKASYSSQIAAMKLYIAAVEVAIVEAEPVEVVKDEPVESLEP
ncbi:MAG: hypothetical protein WCS43_11420 [Verrucomicrobiota bacterium]